MAGMDNPYALVISIANYQHISALPATVLPFSLGVTQLNVCVRDTALGSHAANQRA